jgi:uridylate kinase
MNKTQPINKSPRVLLKISGEALMGDKNFGHDIVFIKSIAEDIKAVVESGVKLSIVVGGGNIYRGEQAAAFGMERATADYIGMLGTVINAIAIQNILESIGVVTRVLSAIPMSTVCEPYIRRKAQRHIEKGRVVIFAAGSGNPFFTTDTAAVLRAVEMNCDLLLKATQVDGVYSDDPKKNANATKFESITYKKVLEDNLKVMDMAAIALARENNLPIIIFSIKNKGNLLNVLANKGNFTKIFEG